MGYKLGVSYHLYNQFNFRTTTLTTFYFLNPFFPPIGVPKIDKLEIEGRGFHTNLYAVRGIYSGGKEGKSRIQWLRSMVGSPDLISIPGIFIHFFILNSNINFRPWFLLFFNWYFSVSFIKKIINYFPFRFSFKY